MCGANGEEREPVLDATGVRAQVFEVIVRQVIAGAPWQALAGPMQINKITRAEVLEEIANRTPPLPPAAACGIPRPPVFKDYRAKPGKISRPHPKG